MVRGLKRGSSADRITRSDDEVLYRGMGWEKEEESEVIYMRAGTALEAMGA
jgi:hypothetical protein